MSGGGSTDDSEFCAWPLVPWPHLDDDPVQQQTFPPSPQNARARTCPADIRYYVGHHGEFGHEFLEFEFRPDGRLRYANSSQYKAKRNNSIIRKEAFVSAGVLAEVKRIVQESEITREDDKHWPEPKGGEDGTQEFEVVLGNQHISFATAKIGSLLDVQGSSDPEGLRIFYYLVQDLKCLVFSLIGLHFRVKPI